MTAPKGPCVPSAEYSMANSIARCKNSVSLMSPTLFDLQIQH
jgi:hypothetical protein